MTRSEILAEAARLVTQDRAAVYGDHVELYDRIAGLWSVDLGVPLTHVDVLRLMTLLKVARAKLRPGHADSVVDACGYLALMGEGAE